MKFLSVMCVYMAGTLVGASGVFILVIMHDGNEVPDEIWRVFGLSVGTWAAVGATTILLLKQVREIWVWGMALFPLVIGAACFMVAVWQGAIAPAVLIFGVGIPIYLGGLTRFYRSRKE